MKDLTIDINVLMNGSGKGNLQHFQSCRLLMKRTMDTIEWYLALDYGGIIRNQYESKLGRGTYGYDWFFEMLKRGKTRPIKWEKIDRGTRTKLKEAHFDPEDFKYVRTAAFTACRIIVSHDDDYSTEVCRILRRRLDVVVKDSEGCLCMEE